VLSRFFLMRVVWFGCVIPGLYEVCVDQTVGSMARVYSHAREDELITT
jgi:hypothetical protein